MLDEFQTHIVPAGQMLPGEAQLCVGFVAWASGEEMKVGREAWARARE